jgi:integrase
MNISALINEFASDLQCRYPKYDNSIIKEVTTHLNDALLPKSLPVLTKKDVDNIEASLKIFKNPHSYRTRLHCACYNDLVFELEQHKIARCPPIVMHIKRFRNTIMTSHEGLLKDVQAVQLLHDELLNIQLYNSHLNKKDDQYTKNEAIEYICTFIASAIIFGKVSLNGFPKAIASLRIKDISINPCFINLTFDNFETYYRYFLPFPASAYFYRCLLFYQTQYSRFSERKRRKPHKPLFQALLNSDAEVIFDASSEISTVFHKWLNDRLRSHDYLLDKPMRVSSFRKAVIAWQVMSSISKNGSRDSILPVLLSVASRRIKSNSLRNKYLFHITPAIKKLNVTGIKRKTHVIKPPKIKSALMQVFNDIKRICKSINQRKPKYADQLRASQEVLEIATVHRADLDDLELIYLKLYATWIANLLKIKNVKIRSYNTILFSVPTVLCTLAAKKIKISKFNSSEVTKIIQNTTSHRKCSKVAEALKRFDNYLKSILSDDYQSPNWGNITINNIPSFTPLIDFDNIKSAIFRCHTFFVYKSSIYMPFDEEKLSSHNNRVLANIIQIGFYTGLRIGEIADLKIRHVFYDEGIMLAVRGKRKTDNSIRNIPLSLLAPKEYIDEFDSYLRDRRKVAKPHSPLFTMLSPKREHALNPRQTSEDAKKVFEAIGISDFTFHDLRHAFANWFLLRWFTAFHRKFIPPDVPFLHYELFQKTYLYNIERLLLGKGNRKEGQSSFTFALAALSRLMGHGGPIITLESYVHVTDWFYYFMNLRTYDQQKILEIDQLESFCQVTTKTLRNKLGINKNSRSKRDWSKLHEHQREFLRQPGDYLLY